MPANSESMKPIPVDSPASNPWLFAVRCFFDLQLDSIQRPLRTRLATLTGGSVLDIGAGNSPWRDWLPKRSVYFGLDVKHAEAFNMDVSKEGDITYYDGLSMPFPDAYFDSALCIEVLEHAEDPDMMIREISRVLKTDAVLILTVPWSARRHHIPHDYHRFTRERLQRLFEANHFDIEQISDRGNEVAVIANKFIALALRTIKSIRPGNFFLAIPFSLLLGIASVVMVIAARISIAMKYESPEDPLGYFCVVKKSAGGLRTAHPPPAPPP